MEGIKISLALAKELNKKFDNWYKIEPFPLKDGTWYVPVEAIEYLEEHFINHPLYSDNLTVRNSAIESRDSVKSLQKDDIINYPLYTVKSRVIDGRPQIDTSDPETAEYLSRVAELGAVQEIKEIKKK